MPEQTTNPELFASTSPHIRSEDSIPSIMYGVLLALAPATLMGVYFFGLHTLAIILISLVVAVACEALMQRVMGQPNTALDGSALITGLLLAMNLPPTSPWWLVVVGSAVSIILGKQIFGGLGGNPFNPALIGRVVLLISWPVQMTAWVKPSPLFSGVVDAVSSATPLGMLKLEGAAKAAQLNLWDSFWGYTGGCLGETSVIALLLGAAYLLWKRYISWHIPISYILTVAVFSGIFWRIDPINYASPLFHIFNGGLLLGAFFMATDYVTTPVTKKGQLVFGVGCGILTMVIRLFGGYPEGVSFSILLMNAATPLIDRYMKPLTFGRVSQ
jgi:electron transport complex protein RnfD